MKVTKGVTRIELTGADAETLIYLASIDVTISNAVRNLDGDTQAERVRLFLVRLFNES